MSNNIIDKIQLSGITYDIGGQGGSGVSVVEVTQAEYDALPSSAKTDTSKMYVITDAEAGDLTNYYTKSETNTLLGGKADTATTYTKTEVDNAITAATATKQDTLVSGTNIKTINNTSILGSGNIDIQGGSKAVTGGTNISVVTGETVDTINCTLPITNNRYNNGVTLGWNGNNSKNYYAVAEGYNSIAYGSSSHAEGNSTSAKTQGSHSEGYNTIAGLTIAGYDQEYCHAEGYKTTAFTYFSHAEGYQNKVRGQASHVEGADNEIINPFGNYTQFTLVGSHAEGKNNKTYNEAEHASGKFNNSVSASTTFGDSGNTLFSVGNGTANDARHNAFEIRQNGDIYITSGNTDIKLQDHLGGGGGGGGKAIEAGRGISVTTGETADTVSFNLPISAGTGVDSITEGDRTTASGDYSHTEGGYSIANGNYSHAEGMATITYGMSSHVEGYVTEARNKYEHASGAYNVSSSATTEFGHSGNTLFSVGNGTSSSAKHNAFEIRQNGDIYITKDGQDVKLQDQLGGGGGGSSYTAGDGIDITNNVISVTGKVDTNTYTAYTAATDAALAAKQTTLTAGTGISIVDNVISATGGGSITIDPSLDSGSTNAVANSAITQEFRSVAHFVGDGYLTGVTFGQEDEYPSGKLTLSLQQPKIKADGLSISVLSGAQWLYVSSINGKRCFSTSSSNVKMFNLVETSAITTSITSVSTDSQVPSAKAVNDKLGGLSIVKLTQAEYDALATKDSNTLYVIVN